MRLTSLLLDALARWWLERPSEVSRRSATGGGRADKSDDGQEERQRIDDLLEAAKATYAEVLDATKHQDDKIGRILTGIAFLTAAAVAVVVPTAAARTQFDVRASTGTVTSVPLVGVATVCFLLCLLASVVLLLLALNVPLKRAKPPTSPDEHDLRGSSIFVVSIADRSLEQWQQEWRERGDLAAKADAFRRDLVGQYSTESHNLAQRVQLKNRRNREAVAVFVFGLLFLAIAVALAVATVASDPSLDHPRAPLRVDYDLWTAAVIGLPIWLLSTLQLRAILDGRRVREPVRKGRRRARRWWLLALSAAGYVAALVAPAVDAERTRALSVVLAASVALSAYGTLVGPGLREERLRPVWAAAGSLVYLAVGLVMKRAGGGVLALCAALLAPVHLLVLTVNRQRRQPHAAAPPSSEGRRGPA